MLAAPKIRLATNFKDTMKKLIIITLALFPILAYPQNYDKQFRDSLRAEKIRIKTENAAKNGTKEIVLLTDFSNKKEAAEYVINYLLERSIKPEQIDDRFYFIKTEMMKCSDATIGPGSLNTFNITFFFLEKDGKTEIRSSGKWASNVQIGYAKDTEERDLVFENKKAYSTYDAFLKMEQIVLGIPHISKEYIKQ